MLGGQGKLDRFIWPGWRAMCDRDNGDHCVASIVEDAEDDGARPVFDAFLLPLLKIGAPEIGITDDKARLRQRKGHV